MAGYQDRMANDFARLHGGKCVLKGVFHRGENKRVVIPASDPESMWVAELLLSFDK